MESSTAAGPETKTMRAVVQSAYGDDAGEVFGLAEVPVPEVGPDEVLVRVAASTVNALDWHYMVGTPYLLRFENGFGTPKRKIPGADLAGTVVQVGSGVTGFASGDQVFGEIDGGGFAEYAVANAGSIAHRPTNLSLADSAALGVAALTALQGLRDWAGMKSGDRVLINGASGGVGTFAVQVARALGASHITAVVSTTHAETAHSLGADRVVDYLKEDFTDLDATFDVFFDNAGSKSLTRSKRMLTEHGTLVMVTGKKGKWIRPMHRGFAGMMRSRFWSQRFITRVAQPSGDDGAVLARLVEEGGLRPVIERRFTLDEAVEALAHYAEGHARGKTVVEVPSAAERSG